MARKKKEKSASKIKDVVQKMKSTYDSIMSKESEIEPEKAQKTNLDYKLCVIKIVESLEKNDELDKSSYYQLIEAYPHIKEILDELIEQYSIYSIYKEDPLTNFEYEPYLLKIENNI